MGFLDLVSMSPVMSDRPAPRLRCDVELRAFDAEAGAGRFIVAVDDHYFVVGSLVACVITESRYESTLGEIARRVSNQAGIRIAAAELAEIFTHRLPAVLFERSATERQPRRSVFFQREIVGRERLLPILDLLAPLFTKAAAYTFAVLFLIAESILAFALWQRTSAPIPAGSLAFGALLGLGGIAIHELGHLAACRRFGARHGGIGFGLYWGFPAFFADVQGAWMLPRRQRAAVDAGGLYLQSIYLIALIAWFAAAGDAAVLSAIVWTHFLMLSTLNPVPKFDGYWLMTDLTGCHNMHQKIRDVARGVWVRLLRRPAAPWPERSDLALLLMFGAVALAYVWYLLAVMAHNIAAVMFEIVTLFAAHTTGWSLLELLAKIAVLLLLVILTVGLSYSLARASSVVLVSSEEPH